MCFAWGRHATLGRISYDNTSFEVPFSFIDGESHACVVVPNSGVFASLEDGETWCPPFSVNTPGHTSFVALSFLTPPLAPIAFSPLPPPPSPNFFSRNRVISHRKIISQFHDAHVAHTKMAAAVELPLAFGALYLLTRLASARRRRRTGKAE